MIMTIFGGETAAFATNVVAPRLMARNRFIPQINLFGIVVSLLCGGSVAHLYGL
jgi:hypothetical protein